MSDYVDVTINRPILGLHNRIMYRMGNKGLYTVDQKMLPPLIPPEGAQVQILELGGIMFEGTVTGHEWIIGSGRTTVIVHLEE